MTEIHLACVVCQRIIEIGPRSDAANAERQLRGGCVYLHEGGGKRCPYEGRSAE